MRIFVKGAACGTLVLYVKSSETIESVKRRIQLGGIGGDVHVQELLYAGKQLRDTHTLAYYDILQDSTLHLVLQTHIYVKTMDERTITLKVGSRETIDDVKAKIQKEEGTPPHLQCLIFGCRVLKGSRTLSDYQVYEKATLILCLQDSASKQSKRPSAGVAPEQSKRARPATQIAPSIQGLATSADRQALEKEQSLMIDTLFMCYEKMKGFLKNQTKKTEEALRVARNKEKELEATNSRLTFEHKPVSLLKAEKEKIEQELVVARNKEKGLQATISELTHKCTSYESQIVALEADGKKTKQVLMVAHSKEKELEATITRLKTENKKTEEELVVAHNKEKEQEATISGLTHKNRVFSAQCTSFENQVTTLEVENKKLKEELVVADKKYYPAARSAGYAEGLEEGKEKWLKSVDFLHHLTDASMQLFNYGFDSCQKQAEHQGFMGQLNKDSALKEAPELKGWESCAQLSKDVNLDIVVVEKTGANVAGLP